MESEQNKRYLTLFDKLAYGLGAFANNLQAAASGGMMIVLNLAFSVNPVLVGVIGAIPRFVDAISDPIVGFASDHARTRWGRRKPFIFIGIIVAGILFALMWQVPGGQSQQFYFVFFLAFLIVFFLAYTFFATPWIALGYELTPNYHERTELMGIQNFLGQIPFLVLAPWFLWFMELDRFGGLANGASILALVVAGLCIGTGVIPALFLHERFANTETDEKTSDQKNTGSLAFLSFIFAQLREFLDGFLETLKNLDFLKLAVATFLVFNGFQLIAAFQSYVLIYYVFGGDRDPASELLGLAGTVSAIVTLVVITATTFLSLRIGKKKTFHIMIGLSAIGYTLKWWCYSIEFPELILLTNLLIPCGLGALFTLMPSMIADVCDSDELKTGERREGMYGSIYWWVVKLGMTIAALLGGLLLEITGFDVDLPAQSEQSLFLMRLFDVIFPAAFSILAILFVQRYTITEENAAEIRRELERRRGVV